MTRQTKTDKRDASKLRAQSERGRRAKAIVEDPLFIEALDEIERVIEIAWKNSSSEDRQARENAYMLQRLVTRFRGMFRQIIVSGSNAKKLLELEEVKSSGGSDSS